MIFDWLLNWKGEWWLEGYDTFAQDSYHLPGTYRTKEKAEKAAKRRLRQLERTQPPETSGGQDGIQDQVYVRGPEGQNIRILPDA
ncbi:hypothetical protein MNBD_ALPHA09-167 [hydrothermal vent metagenome]|uniref:Uncharacterized protein n=1 Tax=hydrothermal vent metagenome TaxID=652676 RepID=A0A3B0T083_9ZZZZ